MKINIWLDLIVLSDVYLKKGRTKNNVSIMRDSQYITFFDNQLYYLEFDEEINGVKNYNLRRRV